MRTLRLFCYAEGRGDCWEAFCTDLDIAVQGKSFSEVYGALNTAVRQYLDYVGTLPEEDRERLLCRRMPLFEYFRIRLKLLFPRRNRNADEHLYTMHCST